METISKDDFKEVLKDVRKAYRLLYLYQKRVIDLVKYIGNQYGMDFDSGWSKFSESAGHGNKARLNRWAWDWLTMYLYEFNMGSRTIGTDEVFFKIVLQSDTGFFDANIQDRLDVTHFISAEKSISRLIFVVSKNAYGCPIHNLLRNKLSQYEDEYESNESGNKWIGKAYPLEEFINQDETDKKIGDFNGFCIKELDVDLINANYNIKEQV